MSAHGSFLHIDELKQCAGCTKALGAAKRCGACSAVLYCDAKCQRAHWDRAHKDTCARLPAPLRGTHWAVPLDSGAKLTVLAGLHHVQNPDGSSSYTLDAGRFDAIATAEYSGALDTGVRFTAVTHVLFAQMVLYATTPPDKLPAKMSFGLDEESLLSAHALLRDARVSRDVLVHLGFHSEEDADLRAILRATHMNAFSAYLFGPSAAGTYMGLSEAGPIRLTENAWRERLHSEALSHLSALLIADHQSKEALALSAAIDLPITHLTIVHVL